MRPGSESSIPPLSKHDKLLNECQMASLILIQVGSLLTTMALRQERVGVGLEYRRKHHWVCYMECLTALLIAHPTDPPTIWDWEPDWIPDWWVHDGIIEGTLNGISARYWTLGEGVVPGAMLGLSTSGSTLGWKVCLITNWLPVIPLLG